MRRTVLISFFVLVLALFVPAFAVHSPAESGENWLVPFKLHGHLIVVKCSVGVLEDLTCIVDSGASETVVDMAIVRRLSLATQVDSATFLTEKAKVWAVTIPELRLGPLRAERLAGIAADLSSLTAEIGIRPQVVIGMDLLHRTNFVIDYHGRRLTFGLAAPLLHSAALVSGDCGSRFALIEATVLGKTVRLQVDTGFDGLLLYRNGLQGRWSESKDGSESMIVAAGQTFFARSFDSSDLQIGDWRAPRAQVSVVDRAPEEPGGFDGLIGTTFLSKRRVAFDFEKVKVYWD